MTKISLIGETSFALLGIYIVMLSGVAMYYCVKAYLCQMNIKIRSVSLLISIVSFIMLFGLANITSKKRELSLLAQFFGNLPCFSLIIFLFVLTFSLVVFICYFKRKVKKIVTENAIKESLDNLPDGVCFSSKSGMPILINVQMNNLCAELFNKSIMNVEDFFNDLKTKPLNNAELIKDDVNVTIKTADNQIWDFRKMPLAINKNEIVELVAYNVTQQYELNVELKERNRRMDAVGERLRKFNREVTRVTREKEILNAIIRVHDDLGRALLMLRKYLAEPKDKRDRKELLFLWKYNTAVMKHETDPDGEGSNWNVLLLSAKNIGVKINLNGDLPKNERQKSVLIAALRECLTNTVKHANGNVIDVYVSEKNEKILIEITNNGKAPNGKIIEKGGLKNLRTIVEDAGGNMAIDSADRFVLKIALPKGE